mgnify:CR=1 FL=1
MCGAEPALMHATLDHPTPQPPPHHPVAPAVPRRLAGSAAAGSVEGAGLHKQVDERVVLDGVTVRRPGLSSTTSPRKASQPRAAPTSCEGDGALQHIPARPRTPTRIR